MASLLDLADARLRGLLDIPTRAARAVVNPTLFSGLLGGKTLPREQGFAEAAFGLPAQTDMSVLDPNQAAYMQGYSQGEPLAYLGMATPFAAPAVVAGAKAVAPKAGIALENYMAQQGLLQPLTAYHGTPHNIRGQFDISKVGTGEGAQAYGHGMYFAENPSVAGEYARNLSNRDIANQGRLNAHANAQRLATLAGDPKYAADDIKFVLESNPNHEQKKLLTETLGFLESGAYKNPLETTGNLYKVDIPDADIPNMLDWDKPLAQQTPEVQAAIQKLSDRFKPLDDMEAKNVTGERLYRRIENSFGKYYGNQANPDASSLLNSVGIKGIRYKDAMSRGADEGTSNFVVFDPSAVKILERNNKKLESLSVYEGAMPQYTQQENLANVFENAGLKVKESGSSHSNSKYVEIVDPVSGEVITARFANHPQSGQAMTLHGPADIEIGDIFKYKSWNEAVDPILERINKSRKKYGDELLIIKQVEGLLD